jgi:hypothetical protein
MEEERMHDGCYRVVDARGKDASWIMQSGRCERKGCKVNDEERWMQEEGCKVNDAEWWMQEERMQGGRCRVVDTRGKDARGIVQNGGC